VAVADGSYTAKKNGLKALGGVWVASALQHLALAQQGHQDRDVAYGAAALAAGMSALCLWRGFKDDVDA
jgi:hypothetical protein